MPMVISPTVTSKWAKGGGPAGDETQNLTLAHALTAEGHDASDDGTGRGTPMVFQPRVARNGRGAPTGTVPALSAQAGETGKGDSAPYVFDSTQITHRENRSQPRPGKPSHTLPANGEPPTVVFQGGGVSGQNGSGIRDDGLAYTLDTASPQSVGYSNRGHAPGDVTETLRALSHGAMPMVGIRRLTPIECERLQGFPDGWTCLCGAEADLWSCTCPDGPRYKGLGNAMTRQVIEWILQRAKEAL